MASGGAVGRETQTQLTALAVGQIRNAAVMAEQERCLLRPVAAHDEHVILPCGDVADRTLDDHASAVDDRHLVAGALDLVQQVRRQEHRSSLVHELTDQPAHLEDPRRVEAVHRLIQDEQCRIREQAPRDPQPLTHAKRVPLDTVVAAIREAHPLES